MSTSQLAEMSRTCPPFWGRLTRWLTAPLDALAEEVAAELRATLFSRLLPVVLGAFIASAAAIAAALHQRSTPLIAWAVSDSALLIIRLGLLSRLIWYRRTHPEQAAPAGAASAHILLSVGWFMLLGFGVGACIASGELAVCLVGSLLAMGVLGAQCGRAFATPRLFVLHCVLLIGPFGVGLQLCPDSLAGWMNVLVPPYVISMIGINRQLHRDYVEMIAGRLEHRRLALRCPLTNLANRRMFDRSLAAVLGAGFESVCVLCLDLDGFKAVNDTLGHQMGDLLLRHVALRLLREVPEGALVARLGGDEFAVLVTRQTLHQTEAMAAAIVAAMRPAFQLAGGATAQVGISVGIAQAGPGSTAPSALFEEADQALYAAKRAGKDTFRWFEHAEASRAA